MTKITENKFIPTSANGVAIQSKVDQLKGELKTLYEQGKTRETNRLVRRKMTKRTFQFALASSILGIVALGALPLIGVSLAVTLPVFGAGLGAGFLAGAAVNATVFRKTNKENAKEEVAKKFEQKGVYRYLKDKTIKRRIESVYKELEKLNDALPRDARNEPLNSAAKKAIRDNKTSKEVSNTMLPPAQRRRV